MKKFMVFVIISLFFVSRGNIGFAHEGKVRGVIADVHLERGKAEADVGLVRLSPTKVAAIVKIPIKSEAKVKKMELVSPCGKKYKANSIEPMPSNKVRGYFDQIASGGGKFRNLCRRIGEFFTPSAYASCGSCGGGSGGHGVSDAERGASLGGLGMLMGRAMADTSQWVTVCVFTFTDNIVHTMGEWIIKLTLDDQGRTQRLKGKSYIGMHPGIGHVAGVPEGGTFIVTGDADKVVSDFGLPYSCCTDCSPVEYIVGPVEAAGPEEGSQGAGTDTSGGRTLTDNDLNAVQDYLDDQNRATRGNITGSGIVSGLEASQGGTPGVSVNRGSGVTSSGAALTSGDRGPSVNIPDNSLGRPDTNEIKDTNPGSYSPAPDGTVPGSAPEPDASGDDLGRADANEARDTNPGTYHITR